MTKSKQLTYSLALTELEEIISAIESEEINIDTLAEKVKRATYLIRFCKGRLRNTEEEVKKVLSEIEEAAEDDQGEIK
ncbi:MAG: Exonuclease small subunit [Nitrospirae bacterium]|nr:Exonuclease small subunit [Nitrospirota bacterium]